MTARDEELLRQARGLDYTDWHLAGQLAGEAESIEAKEKLHRISSRLYHMEEYYSGVL